MKPKHKYYWIILSGIFSFTFLALLPGCRYHCGVLLPTEWRELAVDRIVNLSQESSLTPQLQNALREHFSQEPGVRLTQAEKASLLVQAEIKEIDNARLARAYQRQADDRDRDSQAYQVVLYRISIDVDYKAFSPKEPEKILKSGTVRGQADLSRLADREQAVSSARKQAIDDAARQIVAAICESW